MCALQFQSSLRGLKKKYDKDEKISILETAPRKQARNVEKLAD